LGRGVAVGIDGCRGAPLRSCLGRASAALRDSEAVVNHFVKPLAADDIDGAITAFQIDGILAAFDTAANVRSDNGAALSDHRIMVGAAKISVMARPRPDRGSYAPTRPATRPGFLCPRPDPDRGSRDARDARPGFLWEFRA